MMKKGGKRGNRRGKGEREKNEEKSRVLPFSKGTGV